MQNPVATCGIALLSGLIGAGGADAEDASVDEPNVYACTLETLRDESRCILEAKGETTVDAKAQAAQNLRSVALFAPRYCAEAARIQDEPQPDPRLQKRCETDLQEVAERKCTLSGVAQLLDNHGRFAKAASDCYRGLAAVLRRIRLMAAWSVQCCRCLEKSCGLANDRCNDDLVLRTPSAPVRRCLAQRACEDACEDFVTPPSVEPSAPRGSSKKPASN